MLTKGRTTRTIALFVIAAVLLPAAAHAGSPLGIGTAEPTFNTGGFGGPFLAWVNLQQQTFYRALTGALVAMRSDPWKLWTLVGLSFTYGIFHAAGPGHGKAVISSYMIANEIQLRRGILISFISSFLQGATALLAVSAAYLVLRGTSISLTNATDFLEKLSYLLVALFGAWLLFRKVRSLFASSPAHAPAAALAPVFAHAGHSHHDHALRHAHDHASHDHHGHHHHHDHAHDHGHAHVHGAADFCEECGHAHMPSPESLGGERFSLKEAFSAVFAVGLRPCSGAIIVLTFSLLNGLYLGGVLSVLAMSIGTAITVSALAIMAVSAKGLAMRMAGEGSLGVKIGTAIEIGGAFFVMAVGIILFLATQQYVH
jgi:nickel/cobalt transporter (NicO) family protein